MEQILKEKEIAEGNIAIAAFVGLEKKQWAACFQPACTYWEGDFLKEIYRPVHFADLVNKDNRATDLFFHISWDWLIPAFNLFRTLAIDDKILAHEKEHRSADILNSISQNDLGGTFSKLTEHIKWHHVAVKNETEAN